MSSQWEIASPHIRRVVVFDPAEGLYTSHFESLATGTDLLAKARAGRRWTPEFDFCLDGERVTSLGGDWDLVGVGDAYPQPGFAAQLVIHLRHHARSLEVHVGFQRGDSGTSKRYWITNTGRRPATITRLAIETLPAEIGSPGDLQLDAHYGALPRETFITGRVDDCAVVLRNPRTGDCVIALNEVPGHLKRIETGAWFWEGQVRIMYDTDLFPLEVRVPPGEGWGSDAAQVLLAGSGRAYADPRWVVPAATTAALRRPLALPAWHYNTWDPFGTRIDESTVLQLIPLAARMGCEIFTIDDGWQARYGDNAVSPERFPNGLERISAVVEAHGMRLGLWAPLAVLDHTLVTATAALAAAQCRDAQGQIKTTMTAMGEQIVMCLASCYATQAADRLIELVGRYQLAYLKLDLTTVFNAYGEAPGCHAPGHQHASAAESVAQIYAGIAQVTQAVYARHPDVLIDLTFELWGQKHTIDYGLLRAADLAWISNVGDTTDDAAGPRQARTLLYQRSLAIPVEAMLIGNLRAETGDQREKFATALGACPLMLGDLRQLTDAQLGWYSNKIRWHRALRREVSLADSFFPLGSWRQPSVVEWDGFARLSRAGEGIIVLFRNASGVAQARVQVPLPGVARYTLTSVTAGTALGQVGAAELRAGLDLAFGDDPVVIIELRLAK
ncbi:MAG: alpha-galactosidase [Chloroflexales bacterium]